MFLEDFKNVSRIHSSIFFNHLSNPGSAGQEYTGQVTFHDGVNKDKIGH